MITHSFTLQIINGIVIEFNSIYSNCTSFNRGLGVIELVYPKTEIEMPGNFINLMLTALSHHDWEIGLRLLAHIDSDSQKMNRIIMVFDK